MGKLSNRSQSVRRATKWQWCTPISPISEHKQSWEMVREGAPAISDRRGTSRRHPHCTVHTQLQTAAVQLPWGERLCVGSADTLVRHSNGRRCVAGYIPLM